MSADLGTLRPRNSRMEIMRNMHHLGGTDTLMRKYTLQTFTGVKSDVPGHCRAGLETSSPHREQDTAAASGAERAQALDTGPTRTSIRATALREAGFPPTCAPSPRVLAETQNSMQSPTSKQTAMASVHV